jgi:hypothetical protein
LLISGNGYPEQASIALEEVGLSGSGKATRSSNETSSSPVNFFPMLSGTRPLDLEILPGASGVRISSCLSNVSLVRPHILLAPLRHPHILTRMSNRYRESMTPLLTLLAVVKKLIMGCPCREKHRAIVARNLNREVSNTSYTASQTANGWTLRRGCHITIRRYVLI